MLASLPVEAPAEPFTLARALADRPGLALARAHDGVTYLSCDPSDVSDALDPEPSLPFAPQPFGAGAPSGATA